MSMSRFLCVLTACIACSATACGDDQRLEIVVFQAAPDTVTQGESTQLVFAVVPSNAKLSIAGMGDVSGETSATVTPTENTTYQLTATSDGKSIQKSVTVTVKPHGLSYTDPANGRVRLVLNAAQSNPQVVQLDLVAVEKLERSQFFAIAVNNVNTQASPGAFAIGMNLPIDTTRVTGDTTLFAPGPALAYVPPTPANQTQPPAVQPVSVAKLGDDHVLYTAVSRKRIATQAILTQANEVQLGQVFFSVRLKLQPSAAAGVVFDGSQPMPLYRAAIRDQFGDDFVSQAGIGVGKLEVR